MTTENTRRAQRVSDKLQTLHGGDATDLVLANANHMKVLSDMGKVGSLSIVGILVLAKDTVVWAEVYGHHGLRQLTAEEIARDMRRDHDPDPAHYTPEYRAASTVATVAATVTGWRGGPVHMDGRIILDSSIEGTPLHDRWADSSLTRRCNLKEATQ
jgi:hypothetical protein